MSPDWHPKEDCDNICALCDAQAWHKVAEDEQYTTIGLKWGWRNYVGKYQPTRHPLTNYLCCDCFGSLMGPVAVGWCDSFWREVLDYLEHGSV